MSDSESEASAPLQGFTHDGEMYLRRGDCVYASLRNDDGELVRVGSWSGGTAVIDASAADAADAAAGSATAAGGAVVAAKQSKKAKKRKKKKEKKKERERQARDGEASAESDGDDGRKRKHDADEAGVARESEAVETAPEFPYPADVDDHCESPVEAYQDIAALLHALAATIHPKKPTNVRLYDPFYCAGAAKRNLQAIGFPNVYHEREDFYASCCDMAADDPRRPVFDILVTNPPYSGDHVERIVTFCFEEQARRNGRLAWFLLMPNWVYMKEWYVELCNRFGRKPFFVSPQEQQHRYTYVTPRELAGGGKSGKRAKATAPWVSFWYCDLGAGQGALQTARAATRRVGGGEIYMRNDRLPHYARSSNDPSRKRLRKNQRDARKKKQTST